MELLQNKFRFSNGRQPVDLVTTEVSLATGISVERILGEIPDLAKSHLSAGVFWQSERFSDHPVGLHNALLSQGWVVVKFPALNVDGDIRNEMDGIMRSHAISAETGEIHSFIEFDESDDWLSENLGYASTNAKPS